MLIDLSEAVEFLKGCEDAVILTHQSPDGDCIGAGFALKDLLEALGKRSRVLCSDEFPKRYDFMTSVGSGEEFEPKTVIAVDIAAELSVALRIGKASVYGSGKGIAVVESHGENSA